MSELCNVNFDPDLHLFRVSGEMSLDTVAAVINETADLFKQVSELDIDLSDVTRSDSAGLALLIEWMRQAKKNKQTVQFHNLPPQMLAIASATGLDTFLPIQTTPAVKYERT